MANGNMKPCRCGCGELVAGTWKRGHARRGEGGMGMQPVMPLSADEIYGTDGVEDLGEIPFVAEDRQRPPGAGASPSAGDAPAPPPIPADDEGPGHARKDWRKQQQPGRAPRGAVRALRVTAGIRADINAKVSMPLAIAGGIWEARDPLCGGTFVRQ